MASEENIIDLRKAGSVWASDLSYVMGNEPSIDVNTVIQYWTMLIHKSLPKEDQLRAINAIRRALGVYELRTQSLEAGGQGHEVVDSYISGRAGEGVGDDSVTYIYTVSLAQAIAAENGRKVPTTGDFKEARRRIAQTPVSDYRQYVKGDSEIRQRYGVAVDILVALDTRHIKSDGKQVLVIADAKAASSGLSVKRHFQNITQTSEYWNMLTEQEKAAQEYIFGAQRRIVDMKPVGMILPTADILDAGRARAAGDRQYAPGAQSVGSYITGQEAAEARRRLGLAAAAAQQVSSAGITQSVIIEEARGFGLSESSVRAVRSMPSLIKGIKDPVERVVVPRVSEMSEAERRQARKLTIPDTPPEFLRPGGSVLVRVGKNNGALIGDSWKEFRSFDDMLSSITNKRASRIQLSSANPANMARIITMLSNEGRSVNEIAVSADLKSVVGTRVESRDFDGVTLSARQQLAPGIYVDHIREFSKNEAAIVLHYGNEGIRSIVAKRTERGWLFGGEAAIPVITAPDKDVQSWMADRPVQTNFVQGLLASAEQQIRGSGSRSASDDFFISRMNNLLDLPLAAKTAYQRSVILSGFSAYGRHGLQESPDAFYWVRDETEFVDAAGKTRTLRTPLGELLESVPGLVRSSSGRYFTGRSPEAAIKLAKDLQKTLRPRQSFVYLGNQGDIDLQQGKMKGYGGAANKFHVAVLGSSAHTQGMGYIILPKGADPGRFRVQARMQKSFTIPEGFDWAEGVLEGVKQTVTDKGIKIGTRQRIGADGLPEFVDVYLPVSQTTYSEAALSIPGMTAGTQVKFNAGDRLSINVNAYAPQFSIKHGDIKAFTRLMSYDEAVAYFGEAAVESFMGKGDKAGLPTLVIGHSEVKTLPLFMDAIAQAHGKNLQQMLGGKSEQEIHEIMLKSANQWMQYGRVSLQRPGGYFGPLEQRENIPFLSTEMMLSGTAEWQTGRTRLNPEELNFYKAYFPKLYENIIRDAEDYRSTKKTAMLANAVMTGRTDMPTTGIYVITREEIRDAFEGLPDSPEAYGPMLRILSDRARKKNTGGTKNQYAPLKIEGLDSVLLPSIQSLANISTTGMAGGELNELIHSAMYLFRNENPSQEMIQSYRKRLDTFATARSTERAALSAQLRGALVAPYMLHSYMEEGTVFIPPRDLMRMIPNLRRLYRSLKTDEERLDLMRNVYGLMEGEVVTFHRRPGTDPVYTTIPATLSNPFRDKGLADFLVEMKKNPAGRDDWRPQVSSALMEIVSGDYDVDTALLKLVRDIRVRRTRRDEKGAVWSLTKRGLDEKRSFDVHRLTGDEPPRRKLVDGMPESQRYVLNEWLKGGLIPEGTESIRDLIRYATLRRAKERGAALPDDALDPRNFSDTKKMREYLRIIATESIDPRGQRTGSAYFGSQLGAVMEDLNKITGRGNNKWAMFEALGLERDFSEFEKKRFMSRMDISRGSLQQVRAKIAMGPAYTNLRVLMGALQNEYMRQSTMDDRLWKAYGDIARVYSTLYQKALDLQTPTDQERQALSLMYTELSGLGYFDPYEHQRKRSGVRTSAATRRVSALLHGYGGLRSDFITDVLSDMIGTLGGQFGRQMLKGVTDPSEALHWGEYVGVEPAYLMQGGKVLQDTLSEAWAEVYRIMERVVPQALAESFAGVTKTVYLPGL